MELNKINNQKLLQELKGRVLNQKITPKQLKEIQNLAQEKELAIAYQECYDKNPHLLAESKQWEQAQNQDWIKWNNAKKRK